MPRDAIIIEPADADTYRPRRWQARCLTPGCELHDYPEVADEVSVSLTATVHAGRRGHRVELARVETP